MNQPNVNEPKKPSTPKIDPDSGDRDLQFPRPPETEPEDQPEPMILNEEGSTDSLNDDMADDSDHPSPNSLNQPI